MASSYALPMNGSAQGFGHKHSRSYAAWSQSNGTSPAKNGHLHPGGGHRHHHSEMNGQLHDHGASPYAATHDESHEHVHGHEHSSSTDTTYTLKPFMSRPRGRPRGESDLGRPPSRKSATTGKYGGFSPIHESSPAPPPPPSSWLELPEALTALLLPLPFLFASLAYPSIVAQGRKLPSRLDGAGETPESPSTPLKDGISPNGAQLLHACTLTSTTLILVGLIGRVRAGSDQPLDRRKSFGNAGAGAGSGKNVGRMLYNTVGMLLPMYAAMHLGGAATSLVLLVAVAAGLGALEQKPGKHGMWDSLRRTARTRKTTCAILLLAALLDIAASSSKHGTFLGLLALSTSIVAVPPPLPTAGFGLNTGIRSTTDSSMRMSLPKPSSPLIDSSENALFSLAAGAVLMVITIILSIVTSSSPSIAHHALLFTTLSVASATALVFLSIPSALRTQKKVGLALGSCLIAVFGIWEHPDSYKVWIAFPFLSALLFASVSFDTGSGMLRPHSHSHAHTGHKHAHAHDHHLHGNHSRISAFLISRCTPGSIAHSIMIEKDSRRIAYFGMLNLAFMMVQFFYGFVSGSLGLLTDSIHMLFDCAGLAVGLAAAVMSKWAPNARFPYGYGKIDTLSGFANGVFLMLVSVEIIFDAFERLWEGHELQRLNELLIVSVLGFLVNIVGLTAFGHAHHGHGHSHDHGHGDGDHSHGHHHHDNENMQGIFLHILADALGSVAVIISTVLTKYYGWSGWDPIASGIIAILIFGSAVPLVKSSGMRLLLSLPADVEYGIRNTLQELSSLRGVVGYTVPKFWLEDEGAAHSEVHAHAKEHSDCGHDHSHSHSDHDHGHDHGHGHSNRHAHAHSHHSHDHSHSHSHDAHDHDHGHNHDHDHDHSHPPRQQKVLGVIHIVASRNTDLEDVRERSGQFLKSRGLDVVVHVEPEGDGRCWCGGGNKTN